MMYKSNDVKDTDDLASKYFEDFTKFTCADDNFDDADGIIFGVPYDRTVCFRPGAKFGPKAIRESSWGLETYSPVLKKDLQDCNLCDLQDISLFGDEEDIFNGVVAVSENVARHGKKLIALGGEHSITYPIIRGIKGGLGDPVILHFDAHCDLRDEYLGDKFSHACVMRRCSEVTKNIYQFGIRSGEKEEWDFSKNTKLSMELMGREDVKEIKRLHKPVYVTVDIDILDPAFAPGVGTPEPCGFSTEELLNSLYCLREIKDNIVGFDVVEFSPVYDTGGITSVAAAKIVREMILLMLG
jgi:agmatinase